MESLTPLSEPERRLLRETLGLRCRKARQELGLSQRRLAEVMERSSSWVREIERGDQYAPPYLLEALARATGRTAAWFYGHDGPSLDAVAERLARELRQALAAETAADRTFEAAGSLAPPAGEDGLPSRC